MLFWDFLTAISVAIILMLIFALGFRRRGPWNHWLWTWGLIVLAAWAGGLWLAPFGPAIGGVFWAPFLAAGFAFFLLLAALTPASGSDERERRRGPQRDMVLGISYFVWALWLLLALAVLLGYLL